MSLGESFLGEAIVMRVMKSIVLGIVATFILGSGLISAVAAPPAGTHGAAVTAVSKGHGLAVRAVAGAGGATVRLTAKGHGALVSATASKKK
jgi:hypothetical protein